jgi:superoxide dismutase, Cu-Zn family
MKRSWLIAAGVSLAIGGCSTTSDRDDPDDGDIAATSASADLRDVGGRSVGTVSVTEISGGLRVRVEGTALPAGPHGAHLHTTGLCEGPDFSSAGPHWNPTDRLHGTQNPQGHHLGDLPNLLIGTDGRGTLEFTVPGTRLGRGDDALLDRDGAALVVHSSADDYRTDPSGNSGGRIACGALQPG